MLEELLQPIRDPEKEAKDASIIQRIQEELDNQSGGELVERDQSSSDSDDTVTFYL